MVLGSLPHSHRRRGPSDSCSGRRLLHFGSEPARDQLPVLHQPSVHESQRTTIRSQFKDLSFVPPSINGEQARAPAMMPGLEGFSATISTIPSTNVGEGGIN